MTTSILSQFNLKGSQLQAASETNPAIAVTAGAGSGKTRTLVARYLYLLESGYPIRSLIAITFTDKAAREMRSRIRTEIGKWLTNPALPLKDDAGESADWQKIFNEIDAARIGTIHSLCAEILRAHPAEAGIDPHFSMLEEGLAAVLKAQAVELTLSWAANDPQTAGLFGFFKEGELRRILSSILNRRLDFITKEGFSPPLNDWSLAIGGWISDRLSDRIWKDSFEDLAAVQAKQPDDKLELSRQEVLTAKDAIDRAIKNQDWNTTLAKLAELRKGISTGGRKDNWFSDDLATVRQAMGDLRAFYDAKLKPLIGGPPPKVCWALDEQAAEALPLLRRLLNQLFQEYQHLKDAMEALDFDDLEGKAAQLLRENKNVRARWQRETRAVMVDEFQDTNSRQRQIVYGISGFDPVLHTKSLENSDGSASSSIFIVGDAKQSIYQFRGADVTVFRQVQSDIASANGIPLDLNLTFRSHKALLTSLNALLAPILGEKDDLSHPYQVPFAPLQAFRQAPESSAITAPFIEFILGLGEDASIGREAAAMALTDRLHKLHEQEGFEWGDMALLFRASTAFEVYEDALEAVGIPYITVAGRGFYNRPEIRDILNALAACADPSDDLALAGLLRSPAIGLCDAALYDLRYPLGSNKAKPLWESLNRDPENAPTEQLRALNIITELNALAGRSPAAQVLKRYLDLTGYRTMLGMLPRGSRYQRNVDKLLTDAHRSRMVNLEDFLAYVQTLRDVGKREGEAPAEAEGAVQLMTVHKAKGLEFPLVVIADAAYQPPSWSSAVLLDEKLGMLLGTRDVDGNRPITWKLGSLTEASRDEAEDKRLLYVAATRAKEKLLINGHVKRLKAGNLSLGGWISSLGQVIGLDEVKLTTDVLSPQTLDVYLPSELGGLKCSLHPLTLNALSADSVHKPILQDKIQTEIPFGALPDLAAPLIIPDERLLDEEVLAHETDPPQRVWRIVPQAKNPRGPAWVVGKIVHEALRHWRFPDDDFEAFIMPFILETGLTGEIEIGATIQSVVRLLRRFQKHPLWVEIDASERYHEVPFALPGDHGIIDLLYRSNDDWVIADFKTDEIRFETEVQAIIEREGYDQQVKRYAEAVEAQLGTRPKTQLIFLQVEARKVNIVDIDIGR